MSRTTNLHQSGKQARSISRADRDWNIVRNRRAPGPACAAAAVAEPLEPRRLLSGSTLAPIAAFNGAHDDGPKTAMHASGNVFGVTAPSTREVFDVPAGTSPIYYMPLPTKVTPIPPDLTPIITGSTLPGKVVREAKARGAVTVSLSSRSAAIVNDTATVKLYLSADGAIDSSSTLLTVLHHGIHLEAGEAVALKVPVKSLPATLADGTYTLLAQVSDPSGTASTATGPSIQVAAPFVSLSASGLAVTPPTIVPGKAETLSIIVFNRGNVATTGAATINIGLSNNGRTETTTLETSAHHLVIKPDWFAILRLHFKVPTSQTGNLLPFVSITQDGVSTSEVGPGPIISIATASKV